VVAVGLMSLLLTKTVLGRLLVATFMLDIPAWLLLA
jgi:hypothetical protein